MTILTFLRLVLTFLLLCPLTLGQNQKQQLRKLMSGVDVAVPENDPRPNQPQTYRELKLRWADSTKSTTTELKTEAQIRVEQTALVVHHARSTRG